MTEFTGSRGDSEDNEVVEYYAKNKCGGVTRIIWWMKNRPPTLYKKNQNLVRGME